MKRSLGAAAMAGAAGLLLAGCHLPDMSGQAPTSHPTDPHVTAQQVHQARAALAKLRVAPEIDADDSYDRDDWQPSWRELDGTHNCDAREMALRTEGVYVTPGGTVDGPARYDHGTCEVYEPGAAALDGGTNRWFSVYDGKTVTDPGDLDADHFVSLKEVAESGGQSWPTSRKQRYGMDTPDVVVMVTAHSNRSKGDSDPAEWMPAQAAEACPYAVRWIDTKITWHMSIDRAEKAALTDTLDSCQPR